MESLGCRPVWLPYVKDAHTKKTQLHAFSEVVIHVKGQLFSDGTRSHSQWTSLQWTSGPKRRILIHLFEECNQLLCVPYVLAYASTS